MHIFLSGIGGAGIGPLARIALELGYQVSGSDMKESPYLDDLRQLGINILPGQDGTQMEAIHKQHEIDWFVYASAVSMANPDGPEFQVARKYHIKSTKRDEFLNHIIQEAGFKLLAIAGTHGKTTTTAMCVWLFQQLNLKASWSVGGKMPFANMGHAQMDAEWFIYECDEFDRNFLAFRPDKSIISGLAYDHHEIYPSQELYNQAFIQFIDQSEQVLIYQNDFERLYGNKHVPLNLKIVDNRYAENVSLAGWVNQLDAGLAVHALADITNQPVDKLLEIINRFPGIARRFEYLTPNLVTDYAHTPEKIAGCLAMAKEKNEHMVVVYEPLTNRRQHFIKSAYESLFAGIEKLYWLPAYQAREHPEYRNFEPQELINYMGNPEIATPAALDNNLKHAIEEHRANNQLVIALSGGGAGSLDAWLRVQKWS
ncbi:hypothetical protein KC878_00265 [Candidatus Saccharibacteria bacterium]|nr:hypothetical protein [Candidatus Saccharibacteria bacterium]MCB9821048.1 hypothetical protein [Candidatus Nomurabacteria bacterium]